MNATSSAASQRRVLVFLSLGLAVLVLGGIGYVGMRDHGSINLGGTGQAPASASTAPDSGVGIMSGLARTAISEKRLVAPAGSNAYEFYLSVLQLDPQNKAAQDDLHGVFSEASEDVERSINDNQLDEAQRELSLLREFDSTNYTLALLGSKLDAARQVMIRQDEARAAALQVRSQNGQ